MDLDPQHVYSLGELIDFAESNNPVTRIAWSEAKASAAMAGIAKSELYPTIVATAAGTTYVNVPLLYHAWVIQDIGALQTTLHLDYTLLDFGARRSEITAAQAKLVAANLNFNNEHLTLIRDVSHAYYSLLNTAGLRDAAEVSLKDARAVEQAAVDRRANGLATIPEVLEARALSAEANYQLQAAIGAEKIQFGHLAKVITATPVHPFHVETLDALHIPDALDQSVQDAIQTGFQNRPDLEAKEAQVKASEAEVRHAKTAYYPTISFEGSKGWIRAWGQQNNLPGTYAQTGLYDATLEISWTVFDGFRRESRIAQAKADETTAREKVNDLQDQIADEVWSSYTDAETALQEHEAAIDLLAATSESYSAALESYKDGVRNILDVLAAEKELARARAIDVTARTQVLQSFTDLAFRTGDLLSNHPKGQHP